LEKGEAGEGTEPDGKRPDLCLLLTKGGRKDHREFACDHPVIASKRKATKPRGKGIETEWHAEKQKKRENLVKLVWESERTVDQNYKK